MTFSARIQPFSRPILSVWLLGMLVSVSSPANAQTPCSANCQVDVSKAFSVQFDPPTSGGAPTGYRIYLDGVKLGADIAAAPGTTTVPGVITNTAGPHNIEVSAFNATGEGPTAKLVVTAILPLPGPPTNLKILIQVTIAENGSVTWKVVGVGQ